MYRSLIYMQITELESLRTFKFSKCGTQPPPHPTPIPCPRQTTLTGHCLFHTEPGLRCRVLPTQHSRQPLPRDQGWRPRWILFIIPVPDSRTLTGSRESGFKQSWKPCLLFAHSLFNPTVHLILVSFISCHLIYHSTAWKSKLIKSWDFTRVNSTNSRKPGYWQKRKVT